MFNLTTQPQPSESSKKTFDSKFQIPKLSARSSGHSSHASNQSDDGGKKDALHSSSSAPPTTTMAAYQSPPGNASSMGSIATTAGLVEGGSIAEGASKMLTDFFAMSNLAKMAAATNNAPPKYPVNDMHFNKNLQIYKSLSSDSLPRGHSLSASDLRDQHFSTSNPATSMVGGRPTSSNTSPASLHQSSYHHPPQSISPMNISTNHQVAFNAAMSSSQSSSSSSSSINHSMRPPSKPSPNLAANTTSNNSDSSFKSSNNLDGALDFSGHLHPKSESQHNYKLFDSRHHSSSNASSSSIPSLLSHPNQRTSSNSPSVQVHIVKSPVPSPLVVIPSPRSSSSPCITDDELMDEALIGIGSK